MIVERRTPLDSSQSTFHKVIKNVDFSLRLGELKVGHVIFQRPEKSYGNESDRLLNPSQ